MTFKCRYFLYAFMALSLIASTPACGSDGDASESETDQNPEPQPTPDPTPTPDPDPAPEPDPEPVPDPEPTPEPQPTPDPDPAPVGPVTILLQADGATETYALIDSKGYSSAEAPDNYVNNHPGVKHIRQVHDNTLSKYVFAFDIHLSDYDKDYYTAKSDRQRNEIKTDTKSPANMTGVQGDTHVYKWKFKLPSGMLLTDKFCHIHQIKAAGGTDDDIPLITITLRKKTKGNMLEVIYNKPIEEIPSGSSRSNIYLKKDVPLTDFYDQWVEVTEKVTFSADSNYEITIVRLSDSKTLVAYKESQDSANDLNFWRNAANIVRPKWGIYRSVGENGAYKSQMRDETLHFADFEITETSASRR